ncbi:hypothetical protein BI49514_00310 [Brevibacterium iodinum ATCC 49514]|uniref:Uncharacterized protein n=1 Tax=Brevibacterium iodinum ATCC 49514 TaxID=1255616 RepID=A0A2H1HUX4_9MICO|nr:hypothetical protein [Brevibacterium iodinum]SMX66660.1 hypothetical protein BI49514_00310 [Brevibacterium iodinum ATCC 49514]SUW13594.1 Uncharacterised protein [Brevibacterium iodinum]
MEPTEPISGTFTYVTWEVDPVRRGPFVRKSAARRQFIDTLGPFLAGLRADPTVAHIRLLETTFIAPLAGHPNHDVTLILDGEDTLTGVVEAAIRDHGVRTPTLIQSAGNPIRFGNTDTSVGPVLLNHFVSAAPVDEVAATWQQISDWYGSVLGVSNSTLLAFEEPDPYVVLNYAVVPGPVVRFMLDQMLRPSFYRNVNGRLRRVGARALPIFAQRVDQQKLSSNSSVAPQ